MDYRILFRPFFFVIITRKPNTRRGSAVSRDDGCGPRRYNTIITIGIIVTDFQSRRDNDNVRNIPTTII